MWIDGRVCGWDERRKKERFVDGRINVRMGEGMDGLMIRRKDV